MRAYLRDFAGDMRDWRRELVSERNYLGLGLVALFLPVIFLADLIVHLVDVGPE